MFRLTACTAFAAALMLVACGGSAQTTPTAPTTTTPTTPTTPAGTFFDGSGGVRIAYTIDRPSGAGPFPGIVLVHEGGPVTKDDLASTSATLVQRGFVVLRYDKRGTGFSGSAFEEVSTENSTRQIGLLAGDAVAAVQTLKSASGVIAGKIGLFGVSQAGWVMPLAAAQTSDIKFMAAVVGPVIPVGTLYYYAAQASDQTKTFEQLSTLIAAYPGPTGFDPVPSLQSLSIPMLYQMAASDRVVPTRESVAALNRLTAAGKNITVMQYAGGHELRELPTYYADLFAWLDARK